MPACPLPAGPPTPCAALCMGRNEREKIQKIENYSLIRPLKEFGFFSCNSTFLHEFFDPFWVPLAHLGVEISGRTRRTYRRPTYVTGVKYIYR